MHTRIYGIKSNNGISANKGLISLTNTPLTKEKSHYKNICQYKKAV